MKEKAVVTIICCCSCSAMEKKYTLEEKIDILLIYSKSELKLLDAKTQQGDIKELEATKPSVASPHITFTRAKKL